MPPAAEAGCDASPAFLPVRPINPADLAALTTTAAADMLAWENSGFSVDASVRIALNGIQLRV